MCRTVKEWIDCGRQWATSGEFEKAAVAYCHAIQLNSNHGEAYQYLGEVLLPLDQLDDAEACFYKAIELNPQSVEAFNHLGVIYKKKNRLSEAEICYLQAIKLEPGKPELLYNLGNCYRADNRIEEAQNKYQLALKVNPAFVEARVALAMTYLLQENDTVGWEMYEARLELMGKLRFSIPMWQGENLSSCHILLFYEQGIGDTIQFLRYAYSVALLAAKTTVWVPMSLEQLVKESEPPFKTCTAKEVSSLGADFACSLMSLPYLLEIPREHYVNFNPYLRPSPQIAIKWKKFLGNAVYANKLTVGVVWAGNCNHLDDCNKSVPFQLFSQLFEITTINWVSLQVGRTELQDSNEVVFDCSKELTDFSETAGLIEHLDLVISVDTAVTHLAGAMGKETWLLLPFAPDWRWGLKREDTVWYPGVRLFRQKNRGDWQAVLDRIKQALIGL